MQIPTIFIEAPTGIRGDAKKRLVERTTGSETTLLMAFRKMRLIEEGKEKKEVERIIDEEYRVLAVRRRDREPSFAYPPLTSYIFFTEALNEIGDSI